MWSMVLARTFALVVIAMASATSCDRSGSTTRPSPASPVAQTPTTPTRPATGLAARVDVVDHAEGCDSRATIVRVGIDRDGDGKLSDAERHEPPMTLCSTDAVTTNIVNVPPNAYCPRPNRVVEVMRQAGRSELVVCLDAAEREIEGTYAIYNPH